MTADNRPDRRNARPRPPRRRRCGTPRPRVALLVGYAAALRRSELVALDVGDLAEDGDGLRVFIQRGKTDQERLGDFVGIAHGHLHRHLPDPTEASGNHNCRWTRA